MSIMARRRVIAKKAQDKKALEQAQAGEAQPVVHAPQHVNKKRKG